MPTTDSLIKLFKSLAAADLESSMRIASAICDSEDKKGHRTAARLLRGALRGTFSTATPKEVRNHLHSLPLDSALTRVQGDVSLADVQLNSATRVLLSELLAEWKSRDKLRNFNLSPRNKLFFYGPPGCGKSMTAVAIGSELSLPTYIVRFDAIIGAYLGQTALHLRQLFHFSETVPCVLILDELDALGKKRGNPLDVGELDRIVISLMQELEHTSPQGLIVATSNLPKHIDDALWRRFDLAISFPKPTKDQLATYGRRMARNFGLKLSDPTLRRIREAGSYAESRKVIEAAARRSALKQI